MCTPKYRVHVLDIGPYVNLYILNIGIFKKYKYYKKVHLLLACLKMYNAEFYCRHAGRGKNLYSLGILLNNSQ